MLRTNKFVVFGEGSAAVLRAYLVDRKFRLAVAKVHERITALQGMRKGAAERRAWYAIRAMQVERERVAAEAAAAGASFMGKIWYRMRVRKEERAAARIAKKLANTDPREFCPTVSELEGLMP